MVGEGVADAVRVVRRGVVGGELEAPVQHRDRLHRPGRVALQAERVERVGAAGLAAGLRLQEVADGQGTGADDRGCGQFASEGQGCGRTESGRAEGGADTCHDVGREGRERDKRHHRHDALPSRATT